MYANKIRIEMIGEAASFETSLLKAEKRTDEFS